MRSSQSSFPVVASRPWRPKLTAVRKDGFWTERVVAIVDSPLSGLDASYKPCHQAASVPSPQLEAAREEVEHWDRVIADNRLFNKLRPIRAKENEARARLRAARLAELPSEPVIDEAWLAIAPAPRPALPNIVADPSLVVKATETYSLKQVQAYYENDDSPIKAWAVGHRKDDTYYHGLLRSALSAMKRFRKANPDVDLDIVKSLNERVETIRVLEGV